MACLHTAKQRSLTLLKLSCDFLSWEQSASSAEKAIKMAALTTTLSSCSSENLLHEIIVSSMLAATIQTSFAVMELQKKVGTMRQKMATYAQEGWKGRAEYHLLRLNLNGLGLSQLRLEKSFSNVLQIGIHVLSAQTLEIYNAILTGNIDPKSLNTSIPETFHLMEEDFESSLSGLSRTLEQE